uniref:NAD(+) kinase n=1 Tax=Schistocephalus solidus TaxID=70667 RepID=A0A183TBI6_SCHSO
LERGKSFNDMKRAHRFHAQIIAELTRCLRAHDVEVRVVDFKEYDFSDAEWSDLIISVGGDGTFLSAASKVLSRDKVLVGLNSRPASSEGSLCTANWWYRRIPEFVDRLMLGKFSRFWRQRIRLRLAPYIAPLETQHPEIVNIYNISPNFSPARVAKGTENLDKSRSQTPDSATLTRTLPFRALNEVFVSSSMSARVSEYEISLDGSKFVRQKSSGLIVCTGTGSSAWYYNTNRVTPSLVHSLLALTEEELVACASNERPELQQLQQQSRGGFAGCHSDLPLVNPLQRTCAKTRSLCGKSLTELAEAVAQKYNQELFFSPEAPHMGYAIRDLVANSIFKFGPPFGFAYKCLERTVFPQKSTRPVSKLAPWLHEVLEQVWRDEVVPNDWGSGILLPVFKKGDKTKRENCRDISLIYVTVKVFTMVLRWFQSVRDSRTSPNQVGFRGGRGCVDQIFTLRRILEFHHGYQQPTAVCFIDFAATFGSVRQEKLIVFLLPYPAFCDRIKLVSRMDDGYLCIDGSLAVPFNDGTPAELSINPEDAVCVIDMSVSEAGT